MSLQLLLDAVDGGRGRLPAPSSGEPQGESLRAWMEHSKAAPLVLEAPASQPNISEATSSERASSANLLGSSSCAGRSEAAMTPQDFTPTGAEAHGGSGGVSLCQGLGGAQGRPGGAGREHAPLGRASDVPAAFRHQPDQQQRPPTDHSASSWAAKRPREYPEHVLGELPTPLSPARTVCWPDSDFCMHIAHSCFQQPAGRTAAESPNEDPDHADPRERRKARNNEAARKFRIRKREEDFEMQSHIVAISRGLPTHVKCPAAHWQQTLRLRAWSKCRCGTWRGSRSRRSRGSGSSC